MAPSPALTPTWKSASWNKKPVERRGGAVGADVERSPELKPAGEGDAAEHGDSFDEQLKREVEDDERQMDRDWWVEGYGVGV